MLVCEDEEVGREGGSVGVGDGVLNSVKEVE